MTCWVGWGCQRGWLCWQVDTAEPLFPSPQVPRAPSEWSMLLWYSHPLGPLTIGFKSMGSPVLWLRVTGVSTERKPLRPGCWLAALACCPAPELLLLPHSLHLYLCAITGSCFTLDVMTHSVLWTYSWAGGCSRRHLLVPARLPVGAASECTWGAGLLEVGPHLSLTLQMCESWVYALATCQPAHEDSLLVWTSAFGEGLCENEVAPRPLSSPFRLSMQLFYLSAFFLGCRNNGYTLKSKKAGAYLLVSTGAQGAPAGPSGPRQL